MAETSKIEPVGRRTLYVPTEAIRELRDMVNMSVSRPAMDKMQPGITGMDAKMILARLVPLLDLEVGHDGVRTAVRVLERWRDRPAGIDNLEDYCEFLLGLVTGALSALQCITSIDMESPTSE